MKDALATLRVIFTGSFFGAIYTGSAWALLSTIWIVVTLAAPIIGFTLGALCGCVTGCIGSTIGGGRGWGLGAYWALTAWFYVPLLFSDESITALDSGILVINAVALIFSVPWIIVGKVVHSSEPVPDPYMPLIVKTQTVLKSSPIRRWPSWKRYSVAFSQAILYGVIVHFINIFVSAH